MYLLHQIPEVESFQRGKSLNRGVFIEGNHYSVNCRQEHNHGCDVIWKDVVMKQCNILQNGYSISQPLPFIKDLF